MKTWMMIGIVLLVLVAILILIGPALFKNLKIGAKIIAVIILVAVVAAFLYFFFRETGIGPGQSDRIADPDKKETQETNGGEDGDTILIMVHLDEISVGNESYEEAEDAARAVAELTLTSDKAVTLVDDFATARTYMKLKLTLQDKGIEFTEKEL